MTRHLIYAIQWNDPAIGVRVFLTAFRLIFTLFKGIVILFKQYVIIKNITN